MIASALRGRGGLGVVLPEEPGVPSGFGGCRLPSPLPLALDMRGRSLENAFCRIAQVKS